MELKTKTVITWIMVMSGIICHSLLDLLPLFWNVNITFSDTGEVPSAMMLMMASLAYLLPVCGIICVFIGKRWSLIVNIVLACLIAAFNIAHAGMELFPAENAGQYIVMPLLIIIGILLAYYSVCLLKEHN